MTKIPFTQKLKYAKKRKQTEARNIRKWELIRDQYCPQCTKYGWCTLKANGWWMCNEIAIRRKADEQQRRDIEMSIKT